ncbi:GNAT family N-acetyltransferase [Halorussus ruber]|uniref:GNAT family N-acetyltransferase n=1 Tax=Halorussus ruber TaxID=1126238 RepID=UPI001091E692|nr:GNAT family protein [Halorussus ruber]
MPGVAFSRGERVALYTIEREDTEFLQRGRNHPVVRGPLGLADPTNATQVEETIEEWFETDEGVGLLACLESDDEDSDPEDSDADPTPIGVVTAKDIHLTRPEVAYWLFPDYHGEGYATEALSLLLDHVFDTHDARGVEARVFSHNDASQALLDRLGFTREGELRENRFVEGEYRDEYVYGLLREEWVEERRADER